MGILIVTIIIVLVIQFWVFAKNWMRMNSFALAFKGCASLDKDARGRIVITTAGTNVNAIFSAIIESIKKYISNNNVIDFDLLRDAIDRHCDSVENDISSQTPVPLYLGLVGTMLSIIFGLLPLIQTEAIPHIMSPEQVGALTEAASGVNDLLKGVAIAMTASVVGIILTTITTLRFKGRKLIHEDGKNGFLAWLQSTLLPKVDTTGVGQLVRDLDAFNGKFATNVKKLDDALSKVVNIYNQQQDVIKTLNDLDIQAVSAANVKVLRHLQACVAQIDQFSQYLNQVGQLTTTVSQYVDRLNNLDVLQDVSDNLIQLKQYFERHEAALAKELTKADNALENSVRKIAETTGKQLSELQKQFESQSNKLNDFVDKTTKVYESKIEEMRNVLQRQIDAMPLVAKQIVDLPHEIDALIKRMEKSNREHADAFVRQFQSVADNMVMAVERSRKAAVEVEVQSLPRWFKYVTAGSLTIIAVKYLADFVIWLISLDFGFLIFWN